MAELIAPGTTATGWNDVTIAAGATKALFIKPAAGSDDGPPARARFEIAHKTSGGDYTVLDLLTPANIKDKGGLGFAGTYGVRRLACPVAAGMDVEG